MKIYNLNKIVSVTIRYETPSKHFKWVKARKFLGIKSGGYWEPVSAWCHTPIQTQKELTAYDERYKFVVGGEIHRKAEIEIHYSGEQWEWFHFENDYEADMWIQTFMKESGLKEVKGLERWTENKQTKYIK